MEWSFVYVTSVWRCGHALVMGIRRYVKSESVAILLSITLGAGVISPVGHTGRIDLRIEHIPLWVMVDDQYRLQTHAVVLHVQHQVMRLLTWNDSR